MVVQKREVIMLIEKLTPKQRLKIKSPIVDANNRLNRIFNSFNPFNNEFLSGNKLIDLFSSHFSFYFSNRKNTKTRKIYFCKLDKIVFDVSDDFKAAVIILDTSIENNVTISITHIYIHNSLVVKTIYHAINITYIKVELSAIRCGLNQAFCLANIEHIVVITNSIHVVNKIFDLFIHLYQIQTLAIFKEIREFFKRNHHNYLEF